MDVLAVSISVEGLKSVVLGVLGALFIVILVVRIFNHWVKSEWGKVIGEIAIALVVVVFVFFPDTALQLLKDLANTFTA